MSRLFISEKVAIILIIISILILMISRVKKDDTTMTVFNEQEYNAYIVEFKDEYITTRNLNESFKNEIEAIYPFFSDKYANILQVNWYYMDKTLTFDKNIKLLEDNYKTIFKNNALSDESINLDLYGVRISKIRVFTNNISKYSKYNYKRMNFE